VIRESALEGFVSHVVIEVRFI